MTYRRPWDISTRTQMISLGPALLLTLLLISFFHLRVRIQDLRQELNSHRAIDRQPIGTRHRIRGDFG